MGSGVTDEYKRQQNWCAVDGVAFHLTPVAISSTRQVNQSHGRTKKLLMIRRLRMDEDESQIPVCNHASYNISYGIPDTGDTIGIWQACVLFVTLTQFMNSAICTYFDGQRPKFAHQRGVSVPLHTWRESTNNIHQTISILAMKGEDYTVIWSDKTRMTTSLMMWVKSLPYDKNLHQAERSRLLRLVNGHAKQDNSSQAG